MIPCVIVTRDSQGKRFVLYSTWTYWGAKRILKRLIKFSPQRHYVIYEVWNCPLLRHDA